MNAERQSVLFVTPDWPCPVISGGRMRMTSLLRALKACADVRVLCMPAYYLAYRKQL